MAAALAAAALAAVAHLGAGATPAQPPGPAPVLASDGAPARGVECGGGLSPVVRPFSGGSVACVRPQTAALLGWPEAAPAPRGAPPSHVWGELFRGVPVMVGQGGCGPYQVDTFYYGSQTLHWLHACGFSAYGWEHYLVSTAGRGFCNSSIEAEFTSTNWHTGDLLFFNDCSGPIIKESLPEPGTPSEPARTKSYSRITETGARFNEDAGMGGVADRMASWLGAGAARSGQPSGAGARPFDAGLMTYAMTLYESHVYGPNHEARQLKFADNASYAAVAEFLPLDDAVAVRMHGFHGDHVLALVVADPRLMSHDPSASHAVVNGTYVPLEARNFVPTEFFKAAREIAYPRTFYWHFDSDQYDASHPVFMAAFRVSDIALQNGLLIRGVTDGLGGGLPVADLADVILEVGFPVSAVGREGYASPAARRPPAA